MLQYFLLTIFIFSIHAFPSPNELPTVVNIVGGKATTIEHYPYIVSILNPSGLWCGGSILSKYDVLTAGHCIHYAAPYTIIHAGTSYWDAEGHYYHIASNVTFGIMRNVDLGIIHLKEPLEFGDTCQAIPIATSANDAKPGKMATVIGWGEMDSNEISEQLRAVNVPIIDRKECNDLYANTTVGEILDGEICAGYVDKGGKDACSGDSGGPLVVDGVLVGIVNMGEGCARKDSPGVYTDIAYYHKWIKANMVG